MQNDLSHQLSELNKLKANEKQLMKEASDLQKVKKYLEEELCKLRT